MGMEIKNKKKQNECEQEISNEEWEKQNMVSELEKIVTINTL